MFCKYIVELVKWGMRFQPGEPAKCNMMQITRKQIKMIHASYTVKLFNFVSDFFCDIRKADIISKINRHKNLILPL